MELNRRINFYREQETNRRSIVAVKEPPPVRWLRKDPNDSTIIEDLPLLRASWTELPGNQKELIVDVPRYKNMFRRIVSQHPKPWVFGHIFMPRGEDTNPDYFLPEGEGDDDDDTTKEPQEQSKATLTGTLMRITDYRETKGELTSLIVQAVGSFEVLEASQQTPFAIARAKILPDQEAWGQYVYPIMGTMRTEYRMTSALMDAAQAVAVKEDELYRDLEFHQTVLDPNNRNQEISPFTNTNPYAKINFGYIQQDAQHTFSTVLSQKANEVGCDEMLLASSTLKLESGMYSDQILFWEARVWLQLDRMMTLLQQMPIFKITIPPQLLGLLPTDFEWPSGFKMEAHAEMLEAGNQIQLVGSKSPTVRMSRTYPEYPAMRRASRLSYAVWQLLPDRLIENQLVVSQQLLENSSIIGRLQMAHDQLLTVNGSIEAMIY
jgi:Lon protease-like protein